MVPRGERQAAEVSAAAQGMPVHVVSTSVAGTQLALEAARAVAESTGSHVYVIVPGPVPVQGAARASGDDRSLAATIRRLPEASSPRVGLLTCVARRAVDLMMLIPPRALVFIGGGSRRWWPTREQRLAHRFRQLGYRVVYVHTAA